MNQKGFHPYIGELSFLGREGRISRKEAIEAEKIDENSYAMINSLEKLGLVKGQI